MSVSYRNSVRIFTFFIMIMCSVSCLEDNTDTILLLNGTPSKSHPGIPNDNTADENPIIETTNTSIPNVSCFMESDEVGPVVRLDMTGVQYPNSLDWLRLTGTGEEDQNIWLSMDCCPKGISVHNTIDDVDEDVLVKNDVVFLVDNSGSMSDEADAIARDILSWARSLASRFDIQFGCVGYNGLIKGAINLTSYDKFYQYLQRSTGTNRTVGFSGSDASYLKSMTSSYDLSSEEECGVAALRYADENFSFRKGANRIYVNFTDEANYPANKSKFSVNYLASQSNWPSSKGTVHTVYSGSTNITESTNSVEKPWRMSDYTGGTTLYCNSYFTGIYLDDLPVTSAIQNSYVIRFANIEEYMDGQYHSVKITINDEDGDVRAERTFSIKFN